MNQINSTNNKNPHNSVNHALQEYNSSVELKGNSQSILPGKFNPGGTSNSNCNTSSTSNTNHNDNISSASAKNSKSDNNVGVQTPQTAASLVTSVTNQPYRQQNPPSISNGMTAQPNSIQSNNSIINNININNPKPINTTNTANNIQSSCICSQLPHLNTSLTSKSKLIRCQNYGCNHTLHAICMKISPGDEETISQFECPSCILKKYDPLHHVVDTLIDAQAILHNNNHPNSLDFHLGDQLYNQINDTSELKIEIRCIRIDGSKNIYETTWPDFGLIRMNDQPILELKPLQFNSCLKKRKDEKYLFKGVEGLRQGMNRLSIVEYAPTAQEKQTMKITDNTLHCVSVFIIRQYNVGELVDRIKRTAIRPVNECKEKIQAYFKEINPKLNKDNEIFRYTQEEDCQIDSLSVPLTCNLDMKLIATPAKGKYCKHFQCFSLENFILTTETLMPRKWRCNICKMKCYDIVVDAYLLEILQRMKTENVKNVMDVKFDSNGSYSFDLPKIPSSIDEEDDDEATNLKTSLQYSSVQAPNFLQNQIRNAVKQPLLNDNTGIASHLESVSQNRKKAQEMVVIDSDEEEDNSTRPPPANKPMNQTSIQELNSQQILAAQNAQQYSQHIVQSQNYNIPLVNGFMNPNSLFNNKKLNEVPAQGAVNSILNNSSSKIGEGQLKFLASKILNFDQNSKQNNNNGYGLQSGFQSTITLQQGNQMNPGSQLIPSELINNLSQKQNTHFCMNKNDLPFNLTKPDGTLTNKQVDFSVKDKKDSLFSDISLGNELEVKKTENSDKLWNQIFEQEQGIMEIERKRLEIRQRLEGESKEESVFYDFTELISSLTSQNSNSQLLFEGNSTSKKKKQDSSNSSPLEETFTRMQISNIFNYFPELDLFNDLSFSAEEKMFDFTVFSPAQNYYNQSNVAKRLKIPKNESFFPSFGLQYSNEEESSNSETSDLAVQEDISSQEDSQTNIDNNQNYKNDLKKRASLCRKKENESQKSQDKNRHKWHGKGCLDNYEQTIPQTPEFIQAQDFTQSAKSSTSKQSIFLGEEKQSLNESHSAQRKVQK